MKITGLHMNKAYLTLIVIICLIIVSCSNPLNQTENKLVGSWVEVKENSVVESFTFMADRSFKEANLTHFGVPPFTPVEWNSDGKTLSLSYRLNKFSVFGYILPAHKIDYEILEMTDSTALLKRKTKKSSLLKPLKLRKVKTQGT